MSFKIVIFAAAVFTCQVNAQIGLIRPFTTGFTNGLTEMARPFVQLGQSVLTPASEYINNRRPSVSAWMSYPSQIIPQGQASTYEGYETISSSVPEANYFEAVRPPTDVKPQPQYYQISSQVSSVRPSRPYPASVPQSISSAAEETAEMYRPSNLLIKPQPQNYQISSQVSPVRPSRPYPASVPQSISSAAEETAEMYRPSNLLVKPQPQNHQISSQVSPVRPSRPNPASVPQSISSAAEETAEMYRPSNLLIKPQPAEFEIPKIPKAEGSVTVEGKFEVPTMQRPLPLVGAEVVEDDE